MLRYALENLLVRCRRAPPVDLRSPALGDRVRLLEQRLRAVERKVMVAPSQKPRAPTEQELLLTAMHCLLTPKQVEFLDNNRQGWRAIMAEIELTDEAFRDSGGLYYWKPGGVFPEVVPVRPA